MSLAAALLLLQIAAGPTPLPPERQVPAVTISREEAARLSPQELEERVLANFPHKRIAQVQLSDEKGFDGGPAHLGYILFHEAGEPDEGRICRSRRIMAGFDSVDGAVRGRDPARARTEPRRLFAVSAQPTLAVVEARATKAACAAAPRYTGLPTPQADEAERMIAAFMAHGAGDRDGQVMALRFVGCENQTTWPYELCDADRVLPLVDWTRLSSVNRTSFTGEPVTWHFWVEADRGLWRLRAKPADKGWAVEISREWPPPF